MFGFGTKVADNGMLSHAGPGIVPEWIVGKLDIGKLRPEPGQLLVCASSDQSRSRTSRNGNPLE